MMSKRWWGIAGRGQAAGLALVVSLLSLMLTTVGLSAAAPPALPALFITPAAGSGQAAAAGLRVWRRGILRQRTARVAPEVLVQADGTPAAGVGQRIDLNLFSDARFAMTIVHVTRHSGRSHTWSGPLDGIDHGYAALAFNDGALVGQVIMPQAVYRIGHAPDGTQVVQQIDQATLPREGRPIVPPVSPVPDGLDAKVGAEIPSIAADTAAQIDVMVLYTAAARAAAGGAAAMRAEVDLAVAVTNQAYANSGVAQRLRLVFAGEIAITESTELNSFHEDLNQLTVNPTVAWLRNVTRADLVSLITDHGPDPAFCGLGFLLVTNSTTFAPFAFSVVERICASARLTFAHELGHNMGAHHDPYVTAGDTTLFSYSHGYVDVVGKFRTIMAYDDQCVDSGIFNCDRIPFFSTPLMTFGGRVVGTVSTSDNARTLGQTANTVANLSPALVAPPTVITGLNKAVFVVGDTLVASVGLDNPGRTGTADIYVGLLLPDNSVAFLTNTTVTPNSGFVFGNLLTFASYRPIATGVPLATPFSVNIPSFVSYTWTGGEPRGGYALLLLVVTAGALADGVLASNELLGASLAAFTFPP